MNVNKTHVYMTEHALTRTGPTDVNVRSSGKAKTVRKVNSPSSMIQIVAIGFCRISVHSLKYT